MGKKLIGIMVVGLVIALLLPIGSATLQKTDETESETNIMKTASQLQITLKGGMGVHAFIKNLGTTDVNDTAIEIILDGRGIIWGSQKTTPGYFDIKAGKTQLVISPVFGFGSTNIKFTCGSATQTAKAKVLFWFVFGVE
jgi:type II secretory pathway pseudopilin PulG